MTPDLYPVSPRGIIGLYNNVFFFTLCFLETLNAGPEMQLFPSCSLPDNYGNYGFVICYAIKVHYSTIHPLCIQSW